MRFFLAIICSIILQQSYAVTDTFKTVLDLNQVSNNSLRVVIYTPKIDLAKVRFVIPSNVPGCIAELQTGKLFSNIKAFDVNGREVGVKKLSINEYEFSPSQKLARIEYDVHDSWHYLEDKDILMPQLGTSFVKDKHFLLNFHALVGYLEGYENYNQKIAISRPEIFNEFSGLDLKTTGGVDYAETENYVSLVDNPVLYTRSRDYGFIVGKTHYRVGLYSENDTIKVTDIGKILKTVCEGVDEFCGGITAKEYTFLINYVDPVSEPRKSEEDYGAVQHSRSSVFYFPENFNKYKLQRDIQFTASHELFHLFEPLNMKTDVTSKLNMRAKIQTSNLWMYEGFTEYFSLLMQYQKELITEAEFITEMRNKMNLAQYYEPYSLVAESEKCYLNGNEKNYNNFYYKGAVIAMMLDLKLIKLSKGKMNLKSLMTDMRDNTRANYVIKDEHVITEMVKYSFPEVQDFFDSYVKGTQQLDYNEYLSTIGWKYESQRTDTSHLFVNAAYRYTKASKEFFVTNVSLDQVGFREGDILQRINGKEVTKENLEGLLDKFSNLNYNKKVIFTIKRGEQILELTGDPITITKNQKNYITIEKKIDVEKKTFRKKYSSGGLHKNQMFK